MSHHGGEICWIYQSVLRRNKCVCSGSHALFYGCVRSCAIHNSFASHDGMSFMLVVLTRLIVSEPKHWVTWSQNRHKLPIFEAKRIHLLYCFWLTKSFLTHFCLWCKLHMKNLKFLFAFKTFFEKTKRFLSYQTCFLTKNLELVEVWWITKKTFLF